MEIIEILTQKNCYVGRNDPKYIVVHETDNWSPGAGAKRHGQAMQNGNLAGTVHYYVDDTNIVHTLRHEDGAWAVGDGKGAYGITNYNSINLEICVNPESDYDTAVANAIRLVRHLMEQTGIDIDHVVRHYDASRKHCPRRIIDEGRWDSFKALVSGSASPTPDHTPGGTYTVKSGDTLSGIARTASATLAEIIALNPQISNPNVIHAGDVIHLSAPETPAEPAPAPSPAPEPQTVDAFYRVATEQHGWLPEVRNLDNFAGYEDSPITKVAIRVSAGKVKYRVHIKGGKWLPWVTGYDTDDHADGYAGNGKPIDAVEVYYYTPDGIRPYKRAKYRVAAAGRDYYPWQLDDQTIDGQDGYAGAFGRAITKFQIEIR